MNELDILVENARAWWASLAPPQKQAMLKVINQQAPGSTTSTNAAPVKIDNFKGFESGSVQLAAASKPYLIIPSTTAYKSITIRSRPGNTGVIFIGGPGVQVGAGYSLASGDSIDIPVRDALVYAIDATAGDYVDYAIVFAGPGESA